jgi:hypothetical protein
VAASVPPPSPRRRAIRVENPQSGAYCTARRPQVGRPQPPSAGRHSLLLHKRSPAAKATGCQNDRCHGRPCEAELHRLGRPLPVAGVRTSTTGRSCLSIKDASGCVETSSRRSDGSRWGGSASCCATHAARPAATASPSRGRNSAGARIACHRVLGQEVTRRARRRRGALGHRNTKPIEQAEQARLVVVGAGRRRVPVGRGTPLA